MNSGVIQSFVLYRHYSLNELYERTLESVKTYYKNKYSDVGPYIHELFVYNEAKQQILTLPNSTTQTLCEFVENNKDAIFQTKKKTTISDYIPCLHDDSIDIFVVDSVYLSKYHRNHVFQV